MKDMSLYVLIMLFVSVWLWWGSGNTETVLFSPSSQNAGCSLSVMGFLVSWWWHRVLLFVSPECKLFIERDGFWWVNHDLAGTGQPLDCTRLCLWCGSTAPWCVPAVCFVVGTWCVPTTHTHTHTHTHTWSRNWVWISLCIFVVINWYDFSPFQNLFFKVPLPWDGCVCVCVCTWKYLLSVYVCLKAVLGARMGYVC